MSVVQYELTPEISVPFVTPTPPEVNLVDAELVQENNCEQSSPYSIIHDKELHDSLKEDETKFWEFTYSWAKKYSDLYCDKHVVDADGAEDIVHDVMVRFLNNEDFTDLVNRPTLGSLLSYISVAVNSRSADRYRKYTRRRTDGFDFTDRNTEGLLPDSYGRVPELFMIDMVDILQNYRDSKGLLDPKITAIVLAEVVDMSYEDIAEEMDCSKGTIKSRTSRGRDMLQNDPRVRDLAEAYGIV